MPAQPEPHPGSPTYVYTPLPATASCPFMVLDLVKVLVPFSKAKALAGWPPRRLAFRLGTCVVELTERGAVPVATVEINCVVELTTSGAVPVAAVETSCLPVRLPVALRETPVSAGVPVPEANSRLNFPEGLAVLFPTGSACQRKCWPTAA